MQIKIIRRRFIFFGFWGGLYKDWATAYTCYELPITREVYHEQP